MGNFLFQHLVTVVFNVNDEYDVNDDDDDVNGDDDVKNDGDGGYCVSVTSLPV